MGSPLYQPVYGRQGTNYGDHYDEEGNLIRPGGFKSFGGQQIPVRPQQVPQVPVQGWQGMQMSPAVQQAQPGQSLASPGPAFQKAGGQQQPQTADGALTDQWRQLAQDPARRTQLNGFQQTSYLEDPAGGVERRVRDLDPMSLARQLTTAGGAFRSMEDVLPTAMGMSKEMMESATAQRQLSDQFLEQGRRFGLDVAKHGLEERRIGGMLQSQMVQDQVAMMPFTDQGFTSGLLRGAAEKSPTGVVDMGQFSEFARQARESGMMPGGVLPGQGQVPVRPPAGGGEVKVNTPPATTKSAREQVKLRPGGNDLMTALFGADPAAPQKDPTKAMMSLMSSDLGRQLLESDPDLARQLITEVAGNEGAARDAVNPGMMTRAAQFGMSPVIAAQMLGIGIGEGGRWLMGQQPTQAWSTLGSEVMNRPVDEGWADFFGYARDEKAARERLRQMFPRK